MKSLVESILSSTGSGKNKKIDVEYLLTHGFKLDTYYGNLKTMFIHKETGQPLRMFRDKIVLYIFKVIDYNSYPKRLVVSTIEDLDLVIEWFKMLKYNDSKTEQEKLRKELFKQLKEI